MSRTRRNQMTRVLPLKDRREVWKQGQSTIISFEPSKVNTSGNLVMVFERLLKDRLGDYIEIGYFRFTIEEIIAGNIRSLSLATDGVLSKLQIQLLYYDGTQTSIPCDPETNEVTEGLDHIREVEIVASLAKVSRYEPEGACALTLEYDPLLGDDIWSAILCSDNHYALRIVAASIATGESLERAAGFGIDRAITVETDPVPRLEVLLYNPTKPRVKSASEAFKEWAEKVSRNVEKVLECAKLVHRGSYTEAQRIVDGIGCAPQLREYLIYK